MSIRTKTFLVVAATMAITGLLLQLVLGFGVFGTFSHLEEQIALKDVNRVRNVLAHESERLSQTTSDWAYWDETYQYALDRNSAYREGNLNTTAFTGAGIDVIVILGTSHEVIFAGWNNRAAEHIESLPEFSSTTQKSSHPLFTMLDKPEGISGYCVLAGSPTIVVSRPILTSHNQGPSRGTLIMGRFVSGEFTQDLTKLVQNPVSLIRIDQGELSTNTKEVLTHLNQDLNSPYVRSPNTEVTEGYFLIWDLEENPFLLLCVSTPQDVFLYGKAASHLIAASVIPACLLCCLLLFLLLERVLITRISNLSDQTARIGERGSVSSRVSLSGNDEVQSLAQSINEMLEGLERSGEQTHRSRELYWTMFEHSPLATLLVDPSTGMIKDCNPNASKYYGYSLGDLQKQNLSGLLYDYPENLDHLLTEESPSELPLTFNARSRLSSGRLRDVEGYASLMEIEEHLMALIAIHDVTERRVAQEEVSRLQRFYQLILDSIPTDLAVYDLDGRALYINPAAIEDKDLRRWFIGKTDEDYCNRLGLDPSIAQKRREYRELCISNKCMVLFDEEADSSDGQKKFFLRFFSPVIEPDGQITKVIGYGFDMTERKKAEDALRHSEERYRLLFEGSHDAIAVYGHDLRAILFNSHFEDLIGYNREEYSKIDPLLPVHPEDREKLIQNNRDRLAGRPVERSYGLRLIHKNGELRYVEVTFDPVMRGEEIAGVQGVFRDITEKKKAEEDLREREDRYRLLFDHSNDGIALLGRDLIPLLINDRLLEMLGYTREELLAMNITQVVHPDDLEKVKSNHLRRLKGEPIPRTYEVRLLKRNGEVLEVEGSFDSIYRGTEIIGIQAIVRDTTERKRMQESLMERQKEESIITLAGGIAHDFNNILVGIMGSAALLQEDLVNQPGSGNLVNNILTSAGRMADLTNQLLAYARGGKHRPEPSNANEIISDTLRMLHGSMNPNIRLVCDLDPELWAVHADRTQITQVLLNILVNACESMESGGTLLVRSHNVRKTQPWYGAWPEPVAAGDFIHIMISDTGCGMTEETRKRLFEPFYTTKFMGRGLGMAAAMGIIRNHDGSLSVESELGTGSTFHVHLPRGSMDIPKRHLDTHTATPKSGTVLVVDDEETVRDVAARMLKRLGFNVIEAADGQTAIDIARTHPPDLSFVLLDMQMPNMGGAEVYSRLHSIDPDIRVLISSGYEESTVTDGIAMSDHLAGFVKKPYTIKGLEAAVEKALHHDQGERNGQESSKMGVDA